MNILLLASSSQSRQRLLKDSKISFVVISQNANEDDIDKNLDFPILLRDIARYKMDHIDIPREYKINKFIYVLTADSMGIDSRGIVHGKPKNIQDAIEKIKLGCGKNYAGTACCLDKKIFENGKWILDKRIEFYNKTEFVFKINDDQIQDYIDNSSALNVAGAITIEGYGMQFLESINGSFSLVLGLPMYELKIALKDIGFFKK